MTWLTPAVGGTGFATSSPAAARTGFVVWPEPRGECRVTARPRRRLESAALFERAHAVTPGGVNSPVRAFNAVGGTPRFIERAAGPVPRRRRRHRVRRPGLQLGPDAARPRAPRGARRRARGRRPRHVVRHPDPARGRARRGDRRAHPGREGPPRVLGHRGDDVRDPAGPRVHRPRARREVRRLLPRPRRLAAGPGRLRAGHLRGPRHARCPGGLDRRAPWCCPTTTPRRSSAAFAEHGDRDRLRDHRGGARQHGRGPAGARLQPAARRDLRAARRAVRQRRGDDRLPGHPLRATGASTAPSRAGRPT